MLHTGNNEQVTENEIVRFEENTLLLKNIRNFLHFYIFKLLISIIHALLKLTFAIAYATGQKAG